MEKNEIICACALGKVFGYEPRIALSLVENLGSASAVFALSPRIVTPCLAPTANTPDPCPTAFSNLRRKNWNA